MIDKYNSYVVIVRIIESDKPTTYNMKEGHTNTSDLSVSKYI